MNEKTIKKDEKKKQEFKTIKTYDPKKGLIKVKIPVKEKE